MGKKFRRVSSSIDILYGCLKDLPRDPLADLEAEHRSTYRSLSPPWNDWGHVAAHGRFWAQALAPLLLGDQKGEE